MSLTEAEHLAAYAYEVQLLNDMTIYKRRHKREFVNEWNWYPWQQQAFDCKDNQIMTLAANRSGKTCSAAYQTACDMTGDYPPGWKGFKQTHAPYVLAMGVDNEQFPLHHRL